MALRDGLPPQRANQKPILETHEPVTLWHSCMHTKEIHEGCMHANRVLQETCGLLYP